MRKIPLLLLLCCGFLPLSAQEIYYNFFSNLVSDVCPNDTLAGSQQRPAGWLIYQTTNGNWDGPLDSARCISAQFAGPFSGVNIDLGQIDPNEPLFLRATAEELSTNSTPFQPDQLYNLTVCAHLGNSPANAWLTGSNCAQDVCTGAILGISIPDSNGVLGGATRFHTSLAGTPTGCFTSCIPTEYFAEQRLQVLVLKFSFPAMASLTGQFLNLSNLGLGQDFAPPGYITEVLAGPQYFANGLYTLNVNDVVNNPGFHQNYLALHDPTTYPSVQHESWIEGQPVPNTNLPQIISLVVAPYQTLEVQPFTNFRGAKVLGSDSIRHTLFLVNNGGDICMNFVDLIFGGDDEYQHNGGTVSMHNGFSCMQFHDNSALRVKRDATLHYGNDGAGLLLLCAGSTIALEENSTLYFDGRLLLSECDDQLTPQQIYMDLPPGARLIFTDKAHVTNQFSQQQQMRLQVRMLGGTLDDSALTVDDRAIIQQVWPAPAPRLEDNITLSPNPFSTHLTLEYLSGQQEDLQITWTNLNGQLVRAEHFQTQAGPNTFQPEMPAAAGLYLLRFESATGSCTRKVVKIDP